MSNGSMRRALGVVLAGALLMASCGGTASPPSPSTSGAGTVASSTVTDAAALPSSTSTVSTASSSTAASSQASAPGGDAEDVPACDLLPKDVAESAIGTLKADPVQDQAPAPPLQHATCDYESDGGTILLDLWVAPTAEDAQAFFEMGVTDTTQTIDDLGDQAISTQPLGDISVRLGQSVVDIDIFSSKSQEEELALAEQLAATAISNLP